MLHTALHDRACVVARDKMQTLYSDQMGAISLYRGFKMLVTRGLEASRH